MKKKTWLKVSLFFATLLVVLGIVVVPIPYYIEQPGSTINLKDLIGVLNISGKDFKDSSNQMQQQTEDALMRVLAMATTAGI